MIWLEQKQTCRTVTDRGSNNQSLQSIEHCQRLCNSFGLGLPLVCVFGKGLVSVLGSMCRQNIEMCDVYEKPVAQLGSNTVVI
eukprot:2421284-Amphidinium_carterae.1